MDKREAKLLFERCLPKFAEAVLQFISDISDVKVKEIASLWAGMGALAQRQGPAGREKDGTEFAGFGFRCQGGKCQLRKCLLHYCSRRQD